MKKEGAVIVLNIGNGNEGPAIVWAEEKLGASYFMIVRDSHLALVLHKKHPAIEMLKKEVRALIRVSCPRAIIVASHRREDSISKEALTDGVFRAMHTVKAWNFPDIKKIIGVCFDEGGVPKQVIEMNVFSEHR